MIVETDPAYPGFMHPTSLFGNGVLTWHVFGLFRTSPGWDLWVGGSPNRIKDGIQALTGIMETEWMPYSFTANWRFTRPTTVKFEAGEPFCHFFPVQRGVLDKVTPTFAPLPDNPDLQNQFTQWSQVTDAFRASVQVNPPVNPADHWQKRYFKGIDMHGKCVIADHKIKLRLRDFSKKI